MIINISYWKSYNYSPPPKNKQTKIKTAKDKKVGRVFANGPGDQNPWSSHTKDQKIVLDASLINTQNYKIGIKSKVEQSRERNSAFPNTSV